MLPDEAHPLAGLPPAFERYTMPPPIHSRMPSPGVHPLQQRARQAWSVRAGLTLSHKFARRSSIASSVTVKLEQGGEALKSQLKPYSKQSVQPKVSLPHIPN